MGRKGDVPYAERERTTMAKRSWTMRMGRVSEMAIMAVDDEVVGVD